MTLDSVLAHSDSGIRRIDGAHFERATFETFALPHTFGDVEICNVHFDRCMVSPGTCMLNPGVKMRSVRFTEFSCGDAMHIDAGVEMIDVTIEGARSPSMIWIRSGNGPVEHAPDWSLDIAGFAGEVWIDGIPTERVTRAAQTQIIIDLERFDAADWETLGIGGLSYWRMMGKKVRASGSRTGIASLPPVNSRNYERSMDELKRLRAEGVLY